jgi:phosphopantothenoylcysteine decarboxylase/phosphopantothenate--cysteine ligase
MSLKKDLLKNREEAKIEDTNVQQISHFLSKTKITLVGGGGIAATELPKLARELRRHGAEIYFCVTENCLKFIGIESLRWASGHEVTLNPSGLSEHICQSDAVVISPATADLISKAAQGICSDGPSTLIQSALGFKKTLIFCSTMHESLAYSPCIQENKEKLKKIDGVFFTLPRQEENKEKLQRPEILAMNISHFINKRKFFLNNEKHVIVTLGGTHVLIDPIRCITNLSTGSLGIETAKTFYALGVKLTLICGNISKELPLYDQAKYQILPNYEDIYKYLKEIAIDEYDGILHLIAGSDFAPRNFSSSKIPSKKNSLHLELTSLPKIIDLPNLSKIPYKAAAKLVSGELNEQLHLAKSLLTEKKLAAILYSNAQSAWSKSTEHSGIFLTNYSDEWTETPVSGKKAMAQQLYLSFLNFSMTKKATVL